MDVDFSFARDRSAREQINFAWLLRLRWAAIVVQSITIACAQILLDMRLPLWFLGIVLALEVLSNFGAAWWHRRERGLRLESDLVVTLIMALDITFLTALLYGSGGPFNPFSVFYLIHVSLAAATLRPRRSWCLTMLAVVCFGGLFFSYMPVSALEHHSSPSHHAHEPLASSSMHVHLRGMFWAFTGAAFFVTYFVTRVRHALDKREQELAAADRKQAQLEKLDSLITLAAGAAHELATPLATIMVVARELEREYSGSTPPFLADLRTILKEVTRCREILGNLTAMAGERIGEPWIENGIASLVEEARRATRAPDRVEVTVSADCASAVIVGPRLALTHTLGDLLQNGLDASPTPLAVHLKAACDANSLIIELIDRGHGMSTATLQRLGEPFFSTRRAAGGMGLGVFLAKRVVDQVGGTLEFESQQEKGAKARLVLPLRTPHTSSSLVRCPPEVLREN